MPSSQPPSPHVRIAVFAALLALSAAMAVVSLHKILLQTSTAQQAALALNPRLLHVHDMQVAATRATLDVFAQNTSAPNVFPQTDLLHQRRKIQAAWLGYEQLEARDVARQGLLLETRASLAQFDAALTAAISTPHAAEASAPLLLALERLNRALTDDSGFLQQDSVRSVSASGNLWAAWAWISLALLVVLCAAALAAPRR